MPAWSDARFGFGAALSDLVRRLAELHVGAEAAVHHVDRLPGRRIHAERARALAPWR